MLRENGGEITISIFGKVTFVGDDDTFVALVTLVQGTGTLLIKDNWATKTVRRSLQRQKFKELDERKTKYLSVMDSSGSSLNM